MILQLALSPNLVLAVVECDRATDPLKALPLGLEQAVRRP